MIPGLVLTMLSVRLGLDQRYADRIKQFLDARRDPEGTMHLAGATAASKLLARGVDREIVASLLRIAGDFEELTGTRDAAYSALASAYGVKIVDQIKNRRRRPETEARDEILDWAKSVIEETPSRP
jgi:hypothetical protein